MEQKRSEKQPQPRIGLVIQGPLISKGRSGKTGHIGFRDVTNRDVVDYDCVDSITNISEQVPENIFAIVSTWSNQSKVSRDKIASLFGIDRVLSLDEPKSGPDRGEIIAGNNAYRQFWGTLQAIKAIESRCEYVIKIRTDQSLDLGKLLQEFQCMIDSEPESLFSPIFNSRKPAHLEDFYFGGSIKIVSEILEELLVHRHNLERGDVHRLFFGAAGKVLYSHNLSFDKPFEYIKPKSLLGVWSKVYLSSRDLYLSVMWRGEKMSKLHMSRFKIFGDTCKRRNSPRKILIIWSSFYSCVALLVAHLRNFLST